METVSRHQLKKHPSIGIVNRLLDDILGNVMNENESLANADAEVELLVSSLVEDIFEIAVTENVAEPIGEEEEGGQRKIFPHEKARNDRVAAIRAEFEERYPNFRKEVRDLCVVSKTRQRKKPEVSKVASRKSSRILDQQLPAPMFVGDGGDVGFVVLEDSGHDDGTGVVESEDNVIEPFGEGMCDAGDERSKEASDELVDAGAADSLVNAEGSAVYEAPVCILEDLGDAGDVDGAHAAKLGRFVCLPCEMPFR